MKESRELAQVTTAINNTFGLQAQGKEFLSLVMEAVPCENACLWFLDVNGRDFSILCCLPQTKSNPLRHLAFSQQHPVVGHMKRERIVLAGTSLANLFVFGHGVDLLAPLISRERLVGVLALGKKFSGGYSLKERQMLQSICSHVSPSMEKEYLREQLVQREEDLSTINRASGIIASSLDIQQIFEIFINDLRKTIDIDWSAIALMDNDNVRVMALSSRIGSAWSAGEQMPGKGTPTQWVLSHKKEAFEADLSEKSRFAIDTQHLKQGIRSIICLPIIADSKSIGSLTIACRKPNAYNRRQISLLKELTSQIAMPIENSRLYAEVEEMSRIDGLSGLLNRRSLDEALTVEISRHARYGGFFSLIIFDLDGGLRSVNNKYGHLAGDDLLRKIGMITKKQIRNSDQAFRYGGDEFAILLPNTSIDAAGTVAERVRKQLASGLSFDEKPVTASFGVASWPANGKQANEVIASADAVLYQAKDLGGNQTRYAPNQ